MYGHTGEMLDFAEKIMELWREHAYWSQRTFGTDLVRGPAGPLKHLKLECDEVLANPSCREEYADLLLLVFDAARRAGMTLPVLVREARAKLEVNKARTWPATSANEPVEHLREEK